MLHRESLYAFSVNIAIIVAALLSAQSFAAGKVYVANQDSDTVSVIDVDSLTVINTIAVGDVPHNVNHTPDTNLVLVTNKNVNIATAPTLSLIDPGNDRLLGHIENLGGRIEHVVATSLGRAFVTEDLDRNAVAVIDLDSRRIDTFIGVGVKPHGLWPSPDGSALFVPNQLSGTLSKIDVATRAVVGEAAVGRTPTMAAVSPDGSTVYVTLYDERGVAVVNAGLVESGRLQINDVIAVGQGPAQVAVTPDGRYVVVPCEGPGALYVIASENNEVVAVIPTGAGAHGVDVSDDGRYAFVTNRGPGTLTVVDLATFTVASQIKVGENPAGVDHVFLE